MIMYHICALSLLWACGVFWVAVCTLSLSLCFPFCFWSFFVGVGASFSWFEVFLLTSSFFSFLAFSLLDVFSWGGVWLHLKGVWTKVLFGLFSWFFNWFGLSLGLFQLILFQLVSIWFSVFLLTFNWYLFSWYSIGSLKVCLSFWNSSNWYLGLDYFPLWAFHELIPLSFNIALHLYHMHCSYAFVHFALCIICICIISCSLAPFVCS